ncbi:MAG: sialidase family protein, partial [Candidatus Limnocylindrales bacterium]
MDLAVPRHPDHPRRRRRTLRALLVGATATLLVLPIAPLAAGGSPAARAASGSPITAPASVLAPVQADFSTPLRLGFRSGDDWEPALATDRFGDMYVLYKHYDVPGGGTCPGCDVHVLLQRSTDGGRTWTRPVPIAPGPADGGQYDSNLVVDPIDGRTVWAAFLQGDNSRVAVTHSTDLGRTWAPITIVSGPTPGFDKPELAVRGRMVAVAYDDDVSSFASVSTDGGRKWAKQRIFAGDADFQVPLAGGAGIDSRGNLFFTFESFDAAHADAADGPATIWVARSGDGGRHFTRSIVDVSGAPPPCTDCGYDFLGPQLTLAVGPDDTVYLAWNGTVGPADDGAPERIFFARSIDHGRTYSPRREVSTAPAGAAHAFPALAVGARPGDVRIGWMDTR